MTRESDANATAAAAAIEALIDDASTRLREADVALGQGTLDMRDEAAWLVRAALALPIDDPDALPDEPPSPQQVQACRDLVDARIRTRRPAAYLTGQAWLQGVPFTVDERVIIPRSLIAEVLAEGLVDAWLGREPRRVLDLCTGNGSLAVLCAMAWPDAHVDATDLSADALDVAAINVARHGLAGRIALRRGDGLDAAQGRYDLIVCNPPYVNADAMAALPPEFRAEPALALAGGRDGMDFVRPLLARAVDHLEPDGALVLEIGHEAGHFAQAFPALAPVWLPTTGGDDQVLLLTRETLASAR